MKKFYVQFCADPLYPVEAETKEDAIEKALRWYEEYMPTIAVAEVDDFSDSSLDNAKFEIERD